MTVGRRVNVIERLVNDKITAIYNVDGWEWRKLDPIKKNGINIINFCQNSLYVLEGVFDNYFFYNGERIYNPWNLNETSV